MPVLRMQVWPRVEALKRLTAEEVDDQIEEVLWL